MERVLHLWIYPLLGALALSACDQAIGPLRLEPSLYEISYETKTVRQDYLYNYSASDVATNKGRYDVDSEIIFTPVAPTQTNDFAQSCVSPDTLLHMAALSTLTPVLMKLGRPICSR